MPTQIEQKTMDPEAELSNVQRKFQKLAPMCSIKTKQRGVPQLATQEKQMSILKDEMKETLLCIQLATKGLHAVRNNTVKTDMKKSIVDYENLETVLRDEKSQESELNILNYLAKKLITDLSKTIPTEADEMALLEKAQNRLRRMENRLDMATKRFCLVNATNSQIRDEIHRLLVERNNFNQQWNHTIGRLLRGKEYLMDIYEIATVASSERDDCCKKLEILKWRGLFQLNKDIAEMQSLESDLNHLARLEEFLRTKGAARVCEADEKEEIKTQEEILRCEQKIAAYDKLIDDVFDYAGTEKVTTVMANFKNSEVESLSMFVLLCEVMQQSQRLRAELENLRQQTLDRIDVNEGDAERHDKRLVEITQELEDQQNRTMNMMKEDIQTESTYVKVLKSIDELVGLSKCDVTPLLALLGNHNEVTHYNADKFLKILEIEIKSLLQVAYCAVKPPPPMPKARLVKENQYPKLVADPYVELLRPNRIEKLVPYQPCAFCVEDYIMNQIFETPAVIADKEYIESMFHLEPVNTKFGIYTLTVPGKRHPFRRHQD